MSTRCQIGIYESKDALNTEFEALLYKHSDGYPDEVLPTLISVCSLFEERRGMTDTEYLSAWILVSFMGLHIKQSKGLAKRFTGTMHPDGIDCLGFGISKGFHGDIEYFYKVSPNLIQVYETLCNDMHEWKLIQEIPIIFLKADTPKELEAK